MNEIPEKIKTKFHESENYRGLVHELAELSDDTLKALLFAILKIRDESFARGMDEEEKQQRPDE